MQRPPQYQRWQHSLWLCRVWFCCICCWLLLACQAPGPVQTQNNQPGQPTFGVRSGLNSLQQRLQPTLHKVPALQIQLQAEPQSRSSARLRLRLDLPAAAAFRTQALPLDAIAYIRLSVSGIGLATPLHADGADAEGLIAHSTGAFDLSVSHVPYGKARLVSVSFYDAQQQPLAGMTLQVAFELSSALVQVSLSQRSTPTAGIIAALLAGDQQAQHLAAQLDLTALQQWMDQLLGLSGNAPDYVYQTHPALVLPTAIAGDLLQAEGDLSSLSTSTPAYRQTAAQIQFTLAGLVGQQASLQLSDPISGVLTGLDNGGPQSLADIAPGSWTLRIQAPHHLPLAQTVTLSSGQQLDLGTLTLVSTQPEIQQLTPASAPVGSTITLEGLRFGAEPADNQVLFGSTSAQVTAASATALSVSVPEGLYGTHAVSIQANGQQSNTLNFSVRPALSGFSPGAQFPGQAVLIEGSGFDPQAENNSVLFGSTTATVTAASTDSLTVIVPENIYGTVPVSVSAHGQSSASASFAVRPRIDSLSLNAGNIGASLLISGQGFDPQANQNTVLLGAVQMPVSQASLTELEVTVPQAPNGPIQVSVGAQSSNSLPFQVVPTISLSSPTANQQISGSALLGVSYSSGNPVTEIAYLLDSETVLGSLNTAPYTLNWDTTTVPNGSYTLRARLRDSTGQEVTSEPISVQVVSTSLVLGGGQISFGSSQYPHLIQRLEIRGPGNSGGPLNFNPEDPAGTLLDVLAYDYRNQLLALPKADFVWYFPELSPYPGTTQFPFNNQLQQARYNNGLRKGSATLRVESLSTGKTADLELTALDVPPRLTAFSISPTPPVNCSVTVPSISDVICAVTLQRNTTYTFSATFEDTNADLILSESAAVPSSHALAYEHYFIPQNPPVQNVNAAAAENHNIYISGFQGGLSSGVYTTYGFSAQLFGAGQVLNKTYSAGLLPTQASGGNIAGTLRMRVKTATEQERRITWNITVQ